MQMGGVRTSIEALALVVGLNVFGAEAVKPGPLVGKAAPAFQVPGSFNESFSLETFKGHILVMQFGSSW